MRCEQGINALFEKLDKVKASLVPKTKFAFKSSIRKNNSAISLNDAAELANQPPAKQADRGSGQESSESSGTATPLDAATSSISGAMRPTEPLRRGSLGSFLKAAGVQSSEASAGSQKPAAVRKMSFASSNSVTINSHSNVHIILPSSAAHATSSGSLTHLRRCIVDMSSPTAVGQPFAGLTIKDIKQSLLICGNVSGAAHITNVDSSVILVATRQFRMHECRNCSVYLLVASRPVIEDCSGIRFSPLPEVYVGQSQRRRLATDNF